MLKLTKIIIDRYTMNRNVENNKCLLYDCREIFITILTYKFDKLELSN